MAWSSWAWWKIEKWGSRKWAFMVFLCMTLLHAVSLLFFTRGFLLTRTELSLYSQCSDVLQSPCFPPPFQEDPNVANATPDHDVIDRRQGCWTKPAIRRLVIIVLDALRFDFVAPSTFFEEKKPWMDKLKVLHKLATRPGLSAKIFKAIADPPTTSLQRLKGLTTGGLPTFVDVGNSFGAPAIVEDNLINQLVQNGKQVVMMGDDTWVQLFPHHFNASYPFPSFNVKDLHTVDNGCIENLIPSLYKEEWDVLIAHFLGVDHAGHIFGVDSAQMIEKLEQYNEILENIVEVLESQSGPGGLHEDTLLLVMGDHGQTINGDHGGGSAEEVETSIFALSMRKPPVSLPSEFDTSSCQIDVDGKQICISSIQQLDFAVTVSALLGIPFPFGSIGSVNPELYALATSMRDSEGSETDSGKRSSLLEEWMQNYVNVLCINSWQVKKYIDIYSASSVIGFSDKDISHVSKIYAQAQDICSHTKSALLRCNDESCLASSSALKMQIDAYFHFLSNVAALARSKWTEFNLQMMGLGFCLMLISLIVHAFLIKRLSDLCTNCFPSSENSTISFGSTFAFVAVLIRAFSFLSNSFILEEGKVASFLLATTGLLQLRRAIMKKKTVGEALVLLLLVPFLRFGIELGQSKQAVNSLFLKISSSWTQGIDINSQLWVYISEIIPILALTMLAYAIYKNSHESSSPEFLKHVTAGTLFCYILIAVFWASESNPLNLHVVLGGIKANWIPRIIYAVGILQMLLILFPFSGKERALDHEVRTVTKALALLCAWSSTIIILSGKQGPLVALVSLIGGWCIIRLSRLEQTAKDVITETSTFIFSPVIQWSFLAVCLFFCTGHWCAFDGLRYAAAFTGFEEFNLVRQAVLLTIDTFGFSHILPIIGLPFIVANRNVIGQAEKRNQLFSMQLCLVYLIYGLVMAVATTFTVICVTIQRRHLMVWGLFAPKFVFDAVGLLLTDCIICLVTPYYCA